MSPFAQDQQQDDLPPGSAPARGRPPVAKLVFGLDAWLRRRLGIREYSSSRDCILRISEARADENIILSDGTMLPRGASILELHFWNEHLDILDDRVPPLRWAHRICRQFDFSLRQLTDHLRRDPRLAKISVIRAELAFGTARRSDQLLRIMIRFGFEPGRNARPGSIAARLHCLGQNLLIVLLVLARNPSRLRLDALRRSRVEVYLSCRELFRRYG